MSPNMSGWGMLFASLQWQWASLCLWRLSAFLSAWLENPGEKNRQIKGWWGILFFRFLAAIGRLRAADPLTDRLWRSRRGGEGQVGTFTPGRKCNICHLLFPSVLISLLTFLLSASLCGSISLSLPHPLFISNSYSRVWVRLLVKTPVA